jgi:hypothetical protein
MQKLQLIIGTLVLLFTTAVSPAPSDTEIEFSVDDGQTWSSELILEEIHPETLPLWHGADDYHTKYVQIRLNESVENDVILSAEELMEHVNTSGSEFENFYIASYEQSLDIENSELLGELTLHTDRKPVTVAVGTN